MTEIQSMVHLQQLVRDGERDWTQYGDVYTVYHEGMVLFNYGSAVQFANRWNWFERVSRGLILDEKTGEVIARPFDKFFNWSEGATDAELVEVTEKLDGSLGILMRRNGEYRIATRGSFVSEQALWATEWLHRNCRSLYRDLDDNLTLLFEIIYPDNRIVVDYKGYEGLILVGVRDRYTGEDFFATDWPIGWKRVMRLSGFFTTDMILREAKTLNGTEQEGWVCRFADGQRFKVKGEHYVFLHRLVTQASFKRVIRAMADGTLDSMIEGVPDELIAPVLEWRDMIDEGVAKTNERIEAAFSKAPKGTRKEYALWIKTEHPDLMPYMFLRLDGRDYQQAIYGLAFRDDESLEKIREVVHGDNQN